MHWIRDWSMMPKWVSSETFSKKDKIYKLHRLLPLHFFEVWRNINPELFNAMLMVKLFYLRKYLFTKFLSSFRVNWFLTATTVNIINKCNKYFPHCSPHLSLTIQSVLKLTRLRMFFSVPFQKNIERRGAKPWLPILVCW